MPICYGDKVRIQHVSSGHRLHSHDINYPSGSSQQQVTCFDGKDNNDWFKFKPAHGMPEHAMDGQPVINGQVLRLEHCQTGKNLHSHNVRAHCSGQAGDQHEVSCFQKHHNGDNNDNWRIEVRGTLSKNEEFRLIHVATNGALHSHNHRYPFNAPQNEVTTYTRRDRNDMWRVEDKQQGNYRPQGGHHQHHHPQPHHGGGGGGGRNHIVYGEHVRIKHCSTGHRLHSHGMNYPGGSRQQQVTCFDGKDENDWFKFKPAHGQPGHSRDGQPIRGGDTVRLEHIKTGRNLHSHNIPAHQSGQMGDQHEVSCFQQHNQGDNNDNFRVETQGCLNPGEQFRLIHCGTNGALHSHNIRYGFIPQNEVTTFTKRDQNDMWQVEDRRNRPMQGVAGDVQKVGNLIGGMMGMALGATVGAMGAVVNSQPPPPAYTPQQPGYPPQQPGYPPQQPGYPPQQPGYPPQQPGYPPQQPGYPPVVQPVVQPMPVPVAQPPFQPPAANSTITLTSVTSNKNLRLMNNHTVDAKGGNGQWAKFVVQPTSFLRLACVGHMSNPKRFLALRKNGVVDSGQGAQGCELTVTPSPYAGTVILAHAHGNGTLAAFPDGRVMVIQGAAPTDPNTHFRFNYC